MNAPALAFTFTLADYWDALNRHDWNFRYTEAAEVRRRGQATEDELATAARASPRHGALYAGMERHYSKGTMKPPRP